jgi:hypothetical protein
MIGDGRGALVGLGMGVGVGVGVGLGVGVGVGLSVGVGGAAAPQPVSSINRMARRVALMDGSPGRTGNDVRELMPGDGIHRM